MHRIWTSYITVSFCGALGFFTAVNSVPSPETSILGRWEEQKWEYEKVDKKGRDPENFKYISEEVKHLIGQNLVIHKAETWIFMPGGKVRLIGENTDKTVMWRLLGRGHILQFKYDNDTIENYDLTELDENTMVVNFDTDIQARGIAKLTFKKVNPK